MTGTVPDGEFGDKARGFEDPTQLPQNEAERKAWQDANRAWWESKPMRYDWRDGLASDKATADFFEEIDKRFLSSVEKFLPSRKTPFDALIPFETLGDKEVLEIGVGHGSVGQFLALHARSYTGIDLTQEATDMTTRRFALLGRSGKVLQMDAETMAFTIPPTPRAFSGKCTACCARVARPSSWSITAHGGAITCLRS